MSSSSSPSAVAETPAAAPASASRLRLAAGSAWALLLAFPIAWLLAFLVIPVVLAVTFLAAYVPARQASQVDPILALRQE